MLRSFTVLNTNGEVASSRLFSMSLPKPIRPIAKSFGIVCLICQMLRDEAHREHVVGEEGERVFAVRVVRLESAPQELDIFLLFRGLAPRDTVPAGHIRKTAGSRRVFYFRPLPKLIAMLPVYCRIRMKNSPGSDARKLKQFLRLLLGNYQHIIGGHLLDDFLIHLEVPSIFLGRPAYREHDLFRQQL